MRIPLICYWVRMVRGTRDSLFLKSIGQAYASPSEHIRSSMTQLSSRPEDVSSGIDP